MLSRLVTTRLTFKGRKLVPEDTTKDLGVIYPLVLSLSVRSSTKHVFFFHKRTVLTVINALAFSKLFYIGVYIVYLGVYIEHMGEHTEAYKVTKHSEL